MSKPTDKEQTTYIRKRAFSKIHVTSWLIYLERDGFVRCSFQNCNFMAFDVEEMCSHYGFCQGDSNTDTFLCEHCLGRTASLKKLQLHLVRAHNVSVPESSKQDAEPEEPEPAGKPSRVLVVSWSYFCEKNNYIKCSTCGYLASTLTEMCRHYPICKQEMDSLLYVCPECKGRTINVNPLLWHMERSHKVFKAASQFNHITKTMICYWEREISFSQFASCLHIHKGERDCSFIDMDILGIIEHSQSCKGPTTAATATNQCPHCPKWCNSATTLECHIAKEHEDMDRDCLEVLPERLDSAVKSRKTYSVKKRMSQENVVEQPDETDPELKLEPLEEVTITDDRLLAAESLSELESIKDGRCKKRNESTNGLVQTPEVLTGKVAKENENKNKQICKERSEVVAGFSNRTVAEVNSQISNENKDSTKKDTNNKFVDLVNDKKSDHLKEKIVKEKIVVIDIEQEEEAKKDEHKISALFKQHDVKRKRTERSDEQRATIPLIEVSPKRSCYRVWMDNKALPSTSSGITRSDVRAPKNVEKKLKEDVNIPTLKDKITTVNLCNKNVIVKELKKEGERQSVVKKINSNNKGIKKEKVIEENSSFGLFTDKHSSDESENLLFEESTQEESDVDEVCSIKQKHDFTKNVQRNYLNRQRHKSDRFSPNKSPSTSKEDRSVWETKHHLEGWSLI